MNKEYAKQKREEEKLLQKKADNARTDYLREKKEEEKRLGNK